MIANNENRAERNELMGKCWREKTLGCRSNSFLLNGFRFKATFVTCIVNVIDFSFNEEALVNVE
jgi:hypothetical protein